MLISAVISVVESARRRKSCDLVFSNCSMVGKSNQLDWNLYQRYNREIFFIAAGVF